MQVAYAQQTGCITCSCSLLQRSQACAGCLLTTPSVHERRYAQKMLSAEVNGRTLAFPAPLLATLHSIRQQGRGIAAEAGFQLGEDGFSASFDLQSLIVQMCIKHPPNLINGRRLLEICHGGKASPSSKRFPKFTGGEGLLPLMVASEGMISIVMVMCISCPPCFVQTCGDRPQCTYAEVKPCT